MTDPGPSTRFELDPHLRRVALMIGYMIIIAGFAYAITVLWAPVRYLFNILAPFLVAMVVAYLFNPVVNFVQRRLRLSRIWGVLVVNLMVLAVLAAFIGIIVPILVTQSRAAYHGISQTTRAKILPWAYDQMGIGLGAGTEASLTDLRESFSSWSRTALANPEDNPEQLAAALQAEVDAWLADTLPAPETVAPAPGDSAAAPVASPPLDESATDALRVRIRQWHDAQRPERFTAGADSRLISRVDTWIDQRERVAEGTAPVPSWPELVERFQDWLNAQGIDAERLLGDAFADIKVGDAAAAAASQGFGFLGSLVGSLVGAVTAIVSSVMFLTFVVLVSFYLLIDFAKLRGVMEVLCPRRYEQRFFEVLAKVDEAVGGFIRGQLLTAFLVGLMATAGLFALGLRQYAVLIGVICGIGNLIPYLGPIMGATPAVLYILFSDSYDAGHDRWIYLGLTIGLFALIQFIEGFILQPKIVGKSASLHPVVVILALVIGGQFGIMGMIIALPATAILRVLLKEFFWDKLHAGWRERTGKLALDDIAPRRKKPASPA